MSIISYVKILSLPRMYALMFQHTIGSVKFKAWEVATQYRSNRITCLWNINTTLKSQRSIYLLSPSQY
jgi:hypothetical protein